MAEFLRQYHAKPEFAARVEQAMAESGLLGKFKALVRQFLDALREFRKQHPELARQLDGLVTEVRDALKRLETAEAPKAQPKETKKAKEGESKEDPRAKAPKSSTQLTLSKEDAKPFVDFANSIPDSELYGDLDPEWSDNPRETEPHITVLYGLTEHDPAPVEKVIRDHAPNVLKARLGKLSIFEGEKYDVLKVDVGSDNLRHLHKWLKTLPHYSTFPDYKPHLTIAYLKKGEGKKYVGDARFEGRVLSFNTVTHSPPEGIRKTQGRKEMPLGHPPKSSPKTPVSPAGKKAETSEALSTAPGGEKPVDSGIKLRYVSSNGQSSDRRSDEKTARRALANRLDAASRGTGGADVGAQLREESRTLLEEARREGWLIEPESLNQLIGSVPNRGASEHDVYVMPDKGRVLKVTKPPNFGARGKASEYLKHIDSINAALHDDVQFMGVLQDGERAAIVISQPFINGTKPTEAQVEQWFEQQGYIRDGYNKWRHPKTGVVLADAHNENFILAHDGALVPIDLQVLSAGNITTLNTVPGGESSDAETAKRLNDSVPSDELTPEQLAFLEEFYANGYPNPDLDAKIEAEAEAFMDATDAKIKAEASAKSPQQTALKKAVVDKERAERGMAPLAGPIRRGWGIAGARAAQALEQNPQAGHDLLVSLKNNPHAMEDHEVALMLLHKVNVRHDIMKAQEVMARTPVDSEENKQAKIRYDIARQEQEDIDVFVRPANSEAGRSLAALRMMRDEDWSEAALASQYRTEFLLGEATNAEERAMIRKHSAAIASALAEMQRLEREQEMRGAERGLQKLTTDLAKPKTNRGSVIKRLIATKAKEARSRLTNLFAMGTVPGSGGDVATDSGAAQPTEPSPGGLTEAELRIFQRTTDTPHGSRYYNAVHNGEWFRVRLSDHANTSSNMDGGAGLEKSMRKTYAKRAAVGMDIPHSVNVVLRAPLTDDTAAESIIREVLDGLPDDAHEKIEVRGEVWGNDSIDVDFRGTEPLYTYSNGEATIFDAPAKQKAQSRAENQPDVLGRGRADLAASRLGSQDSRANQDGSDSTQSSSPVNPESRVPQSGALGTAPTLSAAQMADLATVGAEYVADGADTIEKFREALVKEFGEQAGALADRVFPEAQKVHAEALAELEELKKPEGVVKAAKKRLGDAPEGDLDVRLLVGLAKAHIRAGVKDASEMVKLITKDIHELYPDATESQVMRVLSGYGKTSQPTEDEVERKLSEAKAQLRLMSALEDAKKGTAPLKSGFQRGPQSQKVRNLTSDLKHEMRKNGIKTEGPDQLADARKAVVTRLRNIIADLNAIIAGKGKPKAPKEAVVYDAEMKALLKERNELQAYVDDLTGPSPELKWNLAAQRAARASEEFYKRRIAAGDFATKKVAPQTENAATKKAREDAKVAKAEFDALREATGIPQAEALDKVRERLANEIEKVQQRLMTGQKPEVKQRKAATAEIHALQDQLARLKKAERAINANGYTSETKRAQQAAASVQRSIDEMKEKIDRLSRHVPAATKDKRPAPESEELTRLRQERDLLREVYDSLKEAEMPRRLPIEIAVERFEKMVKRKRQEMEDRLKNKQYFEVPESEKLDPRIQQRMDAAQFALEKAQRAWNEELLNRKMEQRSQWSKILDGGAEVLNLSRAVLTSLDLSAVLRQGGFISLGNPGRAIKAVPDMLRAFTSEKAQHAAMQEIRRRKNYPQYREAGLFLTDENEHDLSKMEEAFMSRLVAKIPQWAGGGLVRGSQRSYTTFLNRLRADTFDAMLATLGRDGRATVDEAKALASYINIATGRGIIGRADRPQGTPVLSTVFFAPRLMASRFNLLAGQPMYGGTGRTRKMIAKEYAKFATGVSIAIALAALAKDDDDREPFMVTDPRSSDFLKVRYGNTRLDFFAGLLQAGVLASRVFTGERVDAKGAVKPIRESLRPLDLVRDQPMGGGPKFGEQDTLDVLANFMRSKLSPALGTAVNLATGKDFKGDPVTVGAEALRMLVPISYESIKEAMQDQGIARGSALSLLSILGAGMQTYDTNKKPGAKGMAKPKTPQEQYQEAMKRARAQQQKPTAANFAPGDWRAGMRLLAMR